MSQATVDWMLLVCAAYFGALGAVTILFVLIGFWSARRRGHELDLDVKGTLNGSPLAPGVSIVVPAYNEEATICSCVEAFVGLQYPRFEVVVVNDGSKDRTVDELRRVFDLVELPRNPDEPLATKPIRSVYRSRVIPELVVIDKENGGKSDAINVGINYSRMDLVCVVDADSLIESDSLLRIVEPFAMDPRTIAAGGSIRIANNTSFERGQPLEVRLPKQMVPRIQVLEYLRSFMLSRLPFARVHASVIISGAFGLFRRDILLEIDGYDTTTIGEDAELSVRMQRYMREAGRPYDVAFVPDAICWTECPISLKVLGRQRVRWHQGLCEFLWRHKRCLFNPRFGRLGMIGLPFYFVFELLGPLLELASTALMVYLFATGRVNEGVFGIFMLASVLLGLIQSFSALLIDGRWFRRIPAWRQMLRLGTESLLEMVWYRQLTLYWRIKGTIAWMRGKHTWGAMERAGLATVPAAGAAAPPAA